MLIKNLKKGFTLLNNFAKSEIAALRHLTGFTPLNNPQKGLAAPSGYLTGFTLLELVITVGIIAFALVGLLAFSINLLKTVSLSKNQLIAYNLAEEGAEILNHLGQGCVDNGGGGCFDNQGGVCGYIDGISNYIVIADSDPQTYDPETGFVENRCNDYPPGAKNDSQFMLNPWSAETEKLYLCPAGYVHSSSPIFNSSTCKLTLFKRKIIVQEVNVLFNENDWQAMKDTIGRRYKFISEVRWDSPFGEQKISIPTHVIHFIRID